MEMEGRMIIYKDKGLKDTRLDQQFLHKGRVLTEECAKTLEELLLVLLPSAFRISRADGCIFGGFSSRHGH